MGRGAGTSGDDGVGDGQGGMSDSESGGLGLGSGESDNGYGNTGYSTDRGVSEGLASSSTASAPGGYSGTGYTTDRGVSENLGLASDGYDADFGSPDDYTGFEAGLDQTFGRAADFAMDNPMASIGTVVGGLLGGLPGAFTGNSIGATMDNFTTMDDEEQALSLMGVAVNVAAPAPVAAGFNFARSALSEDTTIAHHAAAAGLGLWGASDSGLISGLIGANAGYGIVGLADRSAQTFSEKSIAGIPGNMTNTDIAGVLGIESTPDATLAGAPTDTGIVSNNPTSDRRETALAAETPKTLWDGKQSISYSGDVGISPNFSTGGTWTGSGFI